METMTKEKKVIKEHLWTETESGPVLLGSHCTNCDEIVFPKKSHTFCPNCHTFNLEDYQLAKEGVIVSCTHVKKQPAGNFYFGEVPFFYGIVELVNEVKLYSLIKVQDGESVQPGSKVQLIIEPLYENENEIMLTYKFEKSRGDIHDRN